MKKSLLFFLMFVLLCGFTLALDLNDNLVACFPFDDATGEDVTNQSQNLTAYNSPTLDTSNQHLGSGCTDLESGSSQYWGSDVAYPDSASYNPSWTYCMWIEIESITGVLVTTTDDGGAENIQIQTGGSWYMRTSSRSQRGITGHPLNPNGWQLACHQYIDGSTMLAWINGTNVENESVTSNLDNIANFKIGSNANGGGSWFDGKIDEVMIWDRVLSQTEMESIWNSGAGITCATALAGGGDSDAPTVTLDSPFDNDNNNTANVGFKFNVTEANEVANCSVWTNNSGWQFDKLNTSTISTTSTNEIKFNLSGGDGDYLWNIECCDDSDNCGFATANFTYTVDTTKPLITWTNPTANLFTNTNITTIGTSSDANLYRVNVSLYNASNVSIYSYLYDLINTTEQLWNVSINFTDGEQEYNLTVASADDHTYGSLNGLTYDVESDGIVFSKGDWSKKILVGYYTDEVHFFTAQQIIDYDINFEIGELNGEYKFNLTFIRPQQDVKFGFAIPKSPNLRLLDESTGHFVWKDWYIDFEDLITTGFPITYYDHPSYHVFYSNTIYCEGNKGTPCKMDPVFGGLNLNQESYLLTYDITNPSITTITPDNNSVDTDGLVTFTFNVSDTNNVTNCSLYIDGEWNQTDVSITKDTTQSFTQVSLTETSHTWIVECFDEAGNVLNTSNHNMNVDIPDYPDAPVGGGGSGSATLDVQILNVTTTTSSALSWWDKLVSWLKSGSSLTIEADPMAIPENTEPEQEQARFSWVWIVAGVIILLIAYQLGWLNKIIQWAIANRRWIVAIILIVIIFFIVKAKGLIN